MIVYQYTCQYCNKITEKEFPMGEAEASVECETEGCGRTAFRFISTPGVIVSNPTHPARNGRGQG